MGKEKTYRLFIKGVLHYFTAFRGRRGLPGLLFSMGCLLPLLSFAQLTQSDGYLIEAEQFQFKGKWIVEKSKDCFAGSLLRIAGGDQRDSLGDAVTVVRMVREGKYEVWVRSADYAKGSGQRAFQLRLNDRTLDTLGNHGKDGYYWEKAGRMELAAGPVLMRLHALSKDYGRCDAVLLTTDSELDPNKVDRVQIGRLRKNPKKMTVSTAASESILPPIKFKKEDSTIVSITNGNLRIAYLKSGIGNKAIACKTEVKVNGIWRQFASNREDHKVMLLSGWENSIDFGGFFPRWKNVQTKHTIDIGKSKYAVDEASDHTNPFHAGEISDAIPVQARLYDESTIEVQYVTKGDVRITGYWHLPEQGYHMEVRFVCYPKVSAQYSIALAAFQGLDTAVVTSVLMPPMFQYKRIPDQQKMLLSSMMQQPVVMVEKNGEEEGAGKEDRKGKQNGGRMTAFMSADPTAFNNEWGRAAYSPVGFTVKNISSEVQPVAFSPVIGMKDANIKGGEKLERRFILGVIPAGVDSALNYMDDHIFKVRDYRKQDQTSLTEALFNMTDLMKNKAFGGWSSTLKGFYDIEGDPSTAPTVVQSAPLAVIAGSIIGMDEQQYIEEGLPTIEYTLSRSGYRWAKDLVPTGYNKTYASLKLNPFTSQFTTAYYVGLNSLLGGLNPWLKQIALPGDTLRASQGYSTRTLAWVEALAAYQLTGKKRWKETAIKQADKYIQQDIYAHSTTPLSHIPFYNAHFYAPWWDLMDMFEATGDQKYLQAARYGATQTLAGIRTYPVVAGGDQTIHPENTYEGNTTMWWKGHEKYRLGFPRVAGDAMEKKLPAWKVSPVGLGFEQPTTYFLTGKGKNVRPVYMNNWAPHLLRLADYTKSPIYRTFARNAVIGRFANYPGYYATGFTDIPMQDSFPYKGPDVSSIYYHHIPAHWAFTWDFLVSEIIAASSHHIDFPYSKQEGFVWFNNRIYNGQGSLYGQKASLWMKRGLVEIDRPEINYITAVSDNKFWLVMYNESDKALTANVRLSQLTAVKAGGKRTSYGPEGALAEKENGDSMALTSGANAIELPARGLRAWALETNPQKEPATAETPALQQGLKVLDFGAPLGRVFLCRIRSPFGWDSMYGFAESGPLKNASLSITCNGLEKTVDTYPFECSFLKFKTDESVSVRVVASVDGKKQVEKTVNFPVR